MLYRQEDLPFTQCGMNPEIIMNPHAVPSRMTIGQLIETTLGKWGSLVGLEGDGTPFADKFKLEEYTTALHDLGFHRRGFEVTFPKLEFSIVFFNHSLFCLAFFLSLFPCFLGCIFRHDRKTNGSSSVHRTNLLPTPEAHGRRQDSCPCPRTHHQHHSPTYGGFDLLFFKKNPRFF